MEQAENFFRFTAPAVLALALVIFADSQEFWYKFSSLLTNVPKSDSAASFIALVLGGGVGIIVVFGFVISSLAYVVVNFLALRTRGADRFFRTSFCEYLRFDDRTELDRGEYEIWRAQSSNDSSRHVVRQISKRWSLGMANLNMVCALLLALVYVISLNVSPSNIWWLIWIDLLLIFLYNFWDGYRSVTNINSFVTAEPQSDGETEDA